MKSSLRERGPPGVSGALRSLRILRIGRIGSASLSFARSLSLYLFLALALFLSYSLKTILVGTLCLNLIVLIPAEHPLNKYFGQRKGIEPAILCVLISSLVSPYRMGNCVLVLLHFKLTAFHLMGRILHRRRNRLQAKVQVMADV